MLWKKYGKTVTIVLASIVAVGASGVWEDGMSQREFWALLVLILGNLGVFVAPANKES